jgi:hypothetical protein
MGIASHFPNDTSPPLQYSDSAFKVNLEASLALTSYTLTYLKLFVDGIKSALDITTSVHYYFLPYE